MLNAVNQLTENMNKKMDTLNSTAETLQSQVTGLRSVFRQQSEKIATLTKPQSSPISPRSNHNLILLLSSFLAS
jgi:uncharacterized protein YoxC